MTRLRTIDRLGECLFVNAAYAIVKKAGAHVSAGLDDGGKPGGIAAGSCGGNLPQVRAKVKDDSTEFVRAFRHECVFTVHCDQVFDLLLQPTDLLLI